MLYGKWRLPEQGFRKARGFVLNKHVKDVVDAMRFILQDLRLDERLFDAMGVELGGTGPTAEQFRKCCMWAAYLHDLGKAGSEFQSMIEGMEQVWIKHGSPRLDPEEKISREIRKSRHEQSVRHEALSGIIAFHEDVFPTLEAELGPWAHLAIVGAMCHHRKLVIRKAFPKHGIYDPNDDAAPPQFQNGHIHKVDLRTWPKLKVKISPTAGADIEPMILQIPQMSLDFSHMELYARWNLLQSDDALNQDETPFSIGVKWLTILADVYGSITAREVEPPPDPADWDAVSIRVDSEGWEALRRQLLNTYDRPNRKSYGDRLKKKLGVPLAKAPLNELQRRINNGVRKNARVVLEAPTGIGKSIGALLWARGAEVDTTRPLLWAMPTIDLVDQTLEDYGDPDLDVRRHSRVPRIEWRETGALRPGESGESDLTDGKPSETEERIRADERESISQALDPRFTEGEITFTTYDQILGCLGFYHRSVLWLPHILNCQIVWDEAHILRSDEQMRRYHELFMRWFPNLRMLHMSATFHKDELQRLETHGAVVCRASANDVEDNFPRYRIHWCGPLKWEADGRQAEFQAGTLWLTNQVARAQDFGRRLEHENTRVYHSRFKNEDRERIVQDVLAGLGRESERNLRVLATQVAELGFDVYARRMMTEACPPEAFIQRLGRVNRDRTAKGPADVFVYLPEDAMPYSRDHGEAVRWEKWIRQFEGRDVSTRELREALHAIEHRTFPSTHLRRVGDGCRETIRDMEWVTEGVLVEDVLEKYHQKAFDHYMRKRIRLRIYPSVRQVLGWHHHRFYILPPNRYHYDSFIGLTEV